MASGWSLLIFYMDCIFQIWGCLITWFLYENQNSVRGRFFEISEGFSNMFLGLYINIFYVFYHSFWFTITFQMNLKISHFRILSHCALCTVWNWKTVQRKKRFMWNSSDSSLVAFIKGHKVFFIVRMQKRPILWPWRPFPVSVLLSGSRSELHLKE